MALLNHRRYRMTVLNKIAQSGAWESEGQRRRIQEKARLEEGVEDIYEEETQAQKAERMKAEEEQIKEYLAGVKSLPPVDKRESPYPFADKLRSMGINPDKLDDPTISPMERERITEELKKLVPYATVGKVPSIAGFNRHFVDPYRPDTTLTQKYFGYYDKEKDEWYPTQYSYVLFYMANYSKFFELEKYLDRSRAFRPPEKHPYKKQYVYSKGNVFYPFNTDMENRITRNFLEILKALEDTHWKTNFSKTEDNFAFLLPVAPDPTRRDLGVDTTQIRYEDGNFRVRGPAVHSGAPGSMVSESEVTKTKETKILEDLLKNPEQFPGLNRALELLKQEYSTRIRREIRNRRRELNFLGNDKTGREMVATAISNAVTEFIKTELIKYIKEEDLGI